MSLYFTVSLIFILFIVISTFIVVPADQNCIKERLGKFKSVLEPGFHFMVPFLDRVAYRHDIREQVLDIPSQSCITKDNIQVEVDGVVYLKVMNPEKASYGIGDYRRASVNLAQTTMRSEIGKLDLDDTFSERDRINENIVKEIDTASDPWGIKVLRYEIKNINPSPHVVDTMEKQMEAERQKRADVTLADAEKTAMFNRSSGEKTEKINISEGERQKQINESEGKAAEISMIADATAYSIGAVSRALSQEGGDDALKMKLAEQYIEEVGKIYETSKVTVVPKELANIKGVFEGIGKVTNTFKS